MLTAGGAQTPESEAALESLCQTYWFPLYAFARRKGRGPEAAEDSVQEFFRRLLAQDSLGAADPERGRFRSFLLTAFQRHMINEAAAGAEARLDDAAMSHQETPERLFERDWALSLLEEALAKVRASYEARGRGELFAALKDVLLPATDLSNHAERAELLGMRPGAVKVAVHRLRTRYRDALLGAVAHTLPEGQDPEHQIQEELERLLSALS